MQASQTSNLHPATAWLKTVVPATAHLSCDSRKLKKGDVFIAYPGARFDARQFIPRAVEQAGAVLWDKADAFSWKPEWTIPNRAQAQLKQECGCIAADWYGQPSAQLWSVGITGTSGKSSSALWLAEALTMLGKRCAIVGTLGIGLIDALHETGLTTPDPVELQRSLRALVDEGARALAMEVSSVGLVEGRANGMRFDVALFTNLSRDHLDYHGSMADYEAAKAQLFAWQGLRTAVINLDDAAGARMAAIANANNVHVLYFSASGDATAELQAHDLVHTADGMTFEIRGPFGARSFKTRLIGSYNVANLLGVLGVLLASDIDIDAALKALVQVKPAPGRLERVDGMPDQALVLVDYAHKPDALEKALAACRPLATARGGKLIVVFGCGGDRDTGKRPLMGRIAEQLADAVILTSDNPRSEDPARIIVEIQQGLLHADQVRVEADRRSAIALALDSATVQDVVLIAGKGHETYQDIAGVKQPFSDVAVAAEILRERHAGATS